MPDIINPTPGETPPPAHAPRLGETLLLTLKGLEKPIFLEGGDGKGGVRIADDAVDTLESAAHGPFTALAAAISADPDKIKECISILHHGAAQRDAPQKIMRILMTQISLYLLGLEDMGRPVTTPN